VKTLINQEWNPCERTREAIKKKFITFDQYKPVLMQFRRENHEQEVENANTVFLNLFNKTFGHDVPKPDLSKEQEIDEQRQTDIDNKSDISKAVEVRATDPDQMSDDDAIAFYMRGRN